jgi:hypothetical protein
MERNSRRIRKFHTEFSGEEGKGVQDKSEFNESWTEMGEPVSLYQYGVKFAIIRPNQWTSCASKRAS